MGHVHMTATFTRATAQIKKVGGKDNLSSITKYEDKSTLQAGDFRLRLFDLWETCKKSVEDSKEGYKWQAGPSKTDFFPSTGEKSIKAGQRIYF